MSSHQRKPCLIPKRLIPGILSKPNALAVDWGFQGLIAYGCQNSIVILEPKTLQIIQTLNLHSSPIVLVKWARENFHHDIAKPYNLRLASVDVQGKIIVWDAGQGTNLAFFSEPNRTVNHIEWLSSQDASVDLMVAIHSPNIVVLWNADTGTELWRKCYDNVAHLRSLTFDPFDLKNVAILGSDCVLFVNDFAINCEPLSTGKKFYMTLDKEVANVPKSPLAVVSKAALTGFRLLIGDERPKFNEVALLECLQLLYLPAFRHHLAAVFPREILILDVSVLQAVSSIPIERSGSPFLRVLPCQQRNALYCIHENGSVSFRFRKFTPVSNKELELDMSNDKSCELTYESACHSESFRVTNKVKPFCGSMCPVSETKVVVMISDGRLFIWNLTTSNGKTIIKSNGVITNPPTIYSPISENLNFVETLKASIAPLLACEAKNSYIEKISLHFALTGSSSAIVSSQVTCIRMCPPLTHKNWPHYHPLVAVGMYNGNIQVFNLQNGHLVRELSVHTCQVRGIEWCSLRSFVSFGYAEPSANHQNSVNNEIKITDLDTGRSATLREGKTSESPVQFIKVSYQRQYLIIVFQSKPFELWNVKSRQLLRELSSNFPIVCALEWAPGHTTRKSKSDFLDEDSLNVLTKEHLVLTDASSKCYHCIAEGSSFRLGSCIPSRSDRDATITSITWKGDFLLMGNSEGTLTVWDLQEKVSKSVSTYQGYIKKVKFGPGKGNMKVLIQYEDGVDIWDAEKVQCLSSLKKLRQPSKVIDIDWCASENPVIAFENSQIIVTALDLHIPPNSNTIADFNSLLPITCPYFLPSKLAFVLKAIMLHGNFTNLNEMCINLPNSAQEVLQAKINSLTDNENLCLRESSITTRCHTVSRLFGDESEIKFWSVLSNCISHSGSPFGMEGDFLTDNVLFKLSEVQRTKRHILLKHNDAQRKKCVRDLILLGQIDHSIQLSLETEANSESYYTESLKACLLTSLNRNPEASQSTVKLVATNLIANNNLLEGVELLCMIDKPYDACRYLSGHGNWDLAVWLAKVRLQDDQYENIMVNWAVHLSSPKVNQKSKAILVYLSLGKYEKVLEMLFQMRHFDRAATFCDVCQEHKLFAESENVTNLCEQVYTEYARFLHSITGPRSIIEHYCNKGGALGKQVLTDIDNLEAGSDDTSNNSKDWSVIPSSNSSTYNSDEFEKVKVAPEQN